MVMDNYAAHKHPKIKAWLATTSRTATLRLSERSRWTPLVTAALERLAALAAIATGPAPSG
ncbi:hypothetical protein [Kineosporia sp. A_224]|uniref:hypothetical protein n=1 Tax=Kineosporia sp. A_224 TaxID=1962180 RepID=UPI001E381CF0|nr:hypothetical protein [Kineosporia sp. A_224]